MAVSKKTLLIDGFSSVQAVRRAGTRKSKPDSERAKTDLPPREREAVTPLGRPDSKSAYRIGSTIVPDRHEIVCYECGYAFFVTGLLRDTICPKCRETLTAGEFTMESSWTGTIKTIGSVTIRRNAVLNAANITARKITVCGNALDATMWIGESLILDESAAIDPDKLTIRELIIKAGANLVIEKRISCRTLRVEGHLKASVIVDSHATIYRGGCMRGRLDTPSLTVEDGGGLIATLSVGKRARK